MDRTIRIFNSFEAADLADVDEDIASTPEQRIATVLELQTWIYPDAAEQGLARICRITQLERR
jgi:hypothetical protein